MPGVRSLTYISHCSAALSKIMSLPSSLGTRLANATQETEVPAILARVRFLFMSSHSAEQIC